MKASNARTSLTIDNALFIAALWGAAWAVGFLLGFG